MDMDSGLGERELLAAWEKIRRSEVSRHGRLRPELQAFGEHAARSIARLSASIRAGTYEPARLRVVRIRKRSGGRRRVVIPEPGDRIVERAVVDRLDPDVDRLLLPTSFGYRRGLGVRDAVAALLEARDDDAGWVLRTDIENCFESIPREEAMRLLAAVGSGDVVAVAGLLAGRRLVGGEVIKGLPQGAGLSPMLANLYLNQVDRAVASQGLALIRYADDIAVPVRERPAAAEALHRVRAAAASQGLSLNEEKTRVDDFSVGVHFLGQTITSSTEVREKVAHPAKATVFVSGPNALLRSKGDRLRVQIDADDRLSVNLFRVRQIVCHGRVGVTTPLLHRVMGLGIDVIFLADSGRYIGRCAATGHIRAGRRRHQYSAAGEPEVRMAIAREVILGKLTNLRTAVMRWSRQRFRVEAMKVVERIEQCREAAGSATTVTKLLGHEGAATAAYFRHMGLLLGDDWGFASRTRRPPQDPVSSLLSFGYALLTMELIAACEIAGLDPYVGFLHSEGRGRPSLALDLIEEFRPVLVDATVVRLVRTSAIRRDDFREDPGRGVLLTDAGRRRFFDAYERRLLQPFSHAGSGRRVTYRAALSLQAGMLAEALETGARYRPVVWK